MKKILTFYLLFICLSLLSAQPKYEVRAAWITTIYGLDWPQTKAISPANIQKQQSELLQILDCLQEAHFNTVLFQTRVRGDVIYPSNIEPFNSILTGKKNGNPGYDPLAFVIEECHKRGMECHAWMVTIPLGNHKYVNSLGKKSITRKKPAICATYKHEHFLNPGHPQTKEYLMELVHEVVSRYDIDGIHLDYIRYPEHAPKFPDRYDYRKYGNGRSLQQWRRDNISEIVRYIYKGVKSLKPWVKVSSSPVGKYQDTSRYSSRGWNAYHTVQQDVQGWLAEGTQDQVYPMMYFKGNGFYPFALDWKEQANGRQIIPGLGIYFLDSKEGDWTLPEVKRQLHFLRSNHLQGAGYYRVKYLMDNTQGLYDLLKEQFYTTPALVPPISWLDSIPPTRPTHLQVQSIKEGYWKLTWKGSQDNDTTQAPTYIVYGSDTYPVDTQNPQHIIAQKIKGTEYIYAPIIPWKSFRYFAVTAIDRYGNESEVNL